MLELKNISFQVPDEKTRNTKEIGILKDVSLTPVSYTHLDVYKRQIQ